MYVDIRQATPEDSGWTADLVRGAWGSTRIGLRGELVSTRGQLALVAGEKQGCLHYRDLEPGVVEIVTLVAATPWQGIGTALVEGILDQAWKDEADEVAVIVSNDNLDALRFFQRRGFALHAIHSGAIDAIRDRKPEIPSVGAYRIPVRDEVELRRPLVR